MTTIDRNPASAVSQHFDVVVAGGGIYGAMILLEATQRGLRALLLEQNDFGSGTSYNSLRIIHGGLRYLQTLDLPRFRESVAERRWFLRTFPDLVRPMPCLMPLYNRGIKRTTILRAALRANDLLSIQRNLGIGAAHAIRNGIILDAAETRRIFPGVKDAGLAGSAVWYDAHVPDSQRVIMETLRWACSQGAQAYNYVEVNDLLKSGNTINGVRATDRETGESYEYRCDHVINATGPGCRQFAAHFDRDIPDLYRPSIAWNILFDRPSPSGHALALTPDSPGAQTYFLHPWKGRLLAGTGHAPHLNRTGSSAPAQESLERFIDDINLIIPDAGLTMDNVEHVYWGNLPVTQDGGTTLAKRAVIHDHGRHGGPEGLHSISGIKFTTSRREAERLLKNITGNECMSITRRPARVAGPVTSGMDYDWLPDADDDSWKMDLRLLIKQESVLHLDDLVLRRTSIGDNPERARKLSAEIAALFDWDKDRQQQEMKKLANDLLPGHQSDQR